MRTNKEEAQVREAKAAKELGGRAHLGSGSLFFDRGDFSDENFLFEDKFTRKSSFRLNYSILEKVEKQARKKCKIPVVRIGFVHSDRELNVIIMEDIHFHNIDISNCWSVLGKSFNMERDLFYSLYLTVSSPVLAQITFKKREVFRKYYIMEWGDFLKTHREVGRFS